MPDVFASPTRSSLPLATAALAFALVVAPNVGVPELTAHDGQRLVHLAALTYVAAWSLAAAPVRRRAAGIVLAAPRSWGAVAVAVVLGVISSSLALSPQVGFLEISMLGGSLLAALFIAAETTLAPLRSLRLLLLGVVASVGLQLLPLLTLPDGTEFLWAAGGIGGGFSHPRFLNQFQVLMLPLLGAISTSNRTGLRWTGRALATLTMWSAVLSEGRGATLATVTALLAVGALGRAGARRWALATAPPVALGAITALLTRRLTRQPGLVVDRPGGVASDNDRFNLWSDALELVPDVPFFGVGPGHLAHAQVVTDHATRPRPAHPHNLTVQLIVEWGVPAGLTLVTLLVVAGLALWLRKRQEQTSEEVLGVPLPCVLAGLTASVGAGLLLSQLSGVLVMPTATTAFILIGGAALGIHQMTTPTSSRSGSSAASVQPLGWGLAALAATATAVCLAEVWLRPPTVQPARIEHYQEIFVEDMPREGERVLHPRFWVQGFRGAAVEPTP